MKRMNAIRAAGRLPTIPVLVSGLIVAGAGCGSKTTPTAKPSSRSMASPQSANSAESSETAAPEPTPVTLSTPPLPGDIFFENPLAIAAGRARLPEPSPTKMAKTEQQTTEAAAKPEGPNWAKLLPAKMLNAEMLHLKDQLTPQLAELASYNKIFTDLPPYLAEMTALAIVAGMHDEQVPWSEQAKYIRDLAAGAGLGELKRGADSYKKVKVPFDKIAKLLGGETPKELPDAAAQGSFLLSVDFPSLMQRFQIAQANLQTKAFDKTTLAKNASDIVREAHVIAALGAVIATDDYSHGDDDVYQEYAHNLRTHALEAASATKSGDLPAYFKALNLMSQSCDQCHKDYR